MEEIDAFVPGSRPSPASLAARVTVGAGRSVAAVAERAARAARAAVRPLTLTLTLTLTLALMLGACTPAFDWRDAAAPDADFRVQLPAKPATLSRRIHLEDREVEMTMVGARVDEVAFTVAVVPAAEPDAQRMVAAMRTQMLRNIGAPPTAPTTAVDVPLVDSNGRVVGRVPMQAITVDGSGAHAGRRLEARFGSWQSHALQAVIVGPPVDAVQSEHFFDSLRLVRK